MPTYIIYSGADDGHIRSYDTNFTTALSGSKLALNTHPGYTVTGMNTMHAEKHIYEAFLSFDTSVIADDEEIVDVQMSQYSGWTANAQTVQWGQQWYIQNWTAPLTTAQWINPTTLRARQDSDIAVNFDILESSTPFKYRFSGRDKLITGISKTAPTKFVVVANTSVMGMAPSGTQELWLEKGVRGPQMIVHTALRSALNSVTLASTSLPDGTTVSVRSNGAASPTMTVGYSLLNGAWTSIGTLHANFAKNISGPNSIAVTSDPEGNFFIVGLRTGSASTLIGQGYKRLTSTTWQAMSPLEQGIPDGNQQTIRSIALSYVVGGKDSSDVPSIYVMTARGASGTRPQFPNHTGGLGGGGWAQDSVILPQNLLVGAGALLRGSVNQYSPHTATGIPSFVDVISIDNNVQAVYVQRGKFSNAEVGGISTINVYKNSGYPIASDSKYVATGVSKLVPVNSETFAHVFDKEGTNLVVRFYNKACQILGEASLPASNFTGGTIGDKWAATYDVVSGVVRVYYTTSASSNTLGRFDVSPVTFAGVNTASMITTLGATGSTNTILRLPDGKSDERRVMIEAANSTTANAKSVQAYYSTVGNKVPSAPVQGLRPNFDASSAVQFSWVFSDANPADVQTGYQIEISRVDTSVIAHDTGKVTSGAATHTLAANVLANGVNYRWRVRTYDTIGVAGTWSAYATFTTAATGTTTITSPSNDGLTFDTSYLNLQWTYAQTGGQTQTKRRVVLTRVEDNTVELDTGLVASTVNNYRLENLSSGVPYRVDVYVTNSANIAVPAASRTFLAFYSEPMTPQTIIRPVEEYIEVQVINPIPAGSRPEVAVNDIYRRRAGVTDSKWILIASIDNNATHRDYAVKSETAYEYQVVGRTL